MSVKSLGPAQLLDPGILWEPQIDVGPRSVQLDEFYTIVCCAGWTLEPDADSGSPGSTMGIFFFLLKRSGTAQVVVDSFFWHVPDPDPDDGMEDYGTYIELTHDLRAIDSTHAVVAFNSTSPWYGGYVPDGLPPREDPSYPDNFVPVVMLTRQDDTLRVSSQVNLYKMNGYSVSFSICVLDGHRFVSTESWSDAVAPQVRLWRRTLDTFAQVAAVDEPNYWWNGLGIGKVGHDQVATFRGSPTGVSATTFLVTHEEISVLYTQDPIPLTTGGTYGPSNAPLPYNAPRTNFSSTMRYWETVDCENNKVLMVWLNWTGSQTTWRACLWWFENGVIYKSDEVDLMTKTQSAWEIWLQLSAHGGDAHLITNSDPTGDQTTIHYMEIDTAARNPSLTRQHDLPLVQEMGDEVISGGTVSPYQQNGVMLYRYWEGNEGRLYLVPLIGDLPLLDAVIQDTRARFVKR